LSGHVGNRPRAAVRTIHIRHHVSFFRTRGRLPAVAGGLLLGLLWSGEPHAQSASAEQPSPEAGEDLQSEYDQAFKALLAHPSDLAMTFRFSELAAKLGYYEEAISALERLLLLNPELPRVKYELGVLYFRLGSYDVARDYLTAAQPAADLPSDAHEEIARLLDEIERSTSRSRLSGSLATGLRYQTNANASPAAASVVSGRVPATLNGNFVKKADWNAFLSGSGRHSYDLQTQNNATIETNGQFYYAKQREVGTVDSAYVEMNVGPRLDLRADDATIANVHTYGLANDVFLDHVQYFYTLGTGLELSRPITDDLTAGGIYEFRFKRFQESKFQPTAPELDSVVHSFTLGTQYAVWENGSLSAGASFAREVARASFNSNRELDLQVGYAHSFDLPFSLLRGPIIVSPALLRIYTTFDSPNPSIDPTKREVTREWRYSLTVHLGIYEGLGADLQILRQSVAASLPNFKFENTSVTLGLSWSF
jgi:tetratricopeptide (TPR) repeat protein